jgi:hypothetical protein
VHRTGRDGSQIPSLAGVLLFPEAVRTELRILKVHPIGGDDVPEEQVLPWTKFASSFNPGKSLQPLKLLPG